MGQLASFNGMLNELVAQADSILKTISSFTDDGDLQGVAYSSMKERMHTVHGGIWRAIRYCAEVMISENNRILPTKINYFNDVYVDTDIIQRTIDSLNMNNQFLKAFPNLTIGTEYLYQRNLNTIRTLELKLSNIDAYDSSTAGFFSEANQYMNHIMNALTQLQNDDYDAATGTFKNTIDMGWSSDISVKYKEFMLQKFVNADGTITEAGKKYFGDAMKKDFTTLTFEEIDILSEMFLRVSLEDSVYLLDLGYCEILDKEKYGVDKVGTPSYINGDILGASDSFVLVLAVAKNKLDGLIAKSSIDNKDQVGLDTGVKNGPSDLHVRSMLLQGMLTTVTDLSYIQNVKGLSPNVISKNLIIRINDKNDIIVQPVGIGNVGYVTRVNDLGVNSEGNDEIDKAVLNAQKMEGRVAWILGLASYIPTVGPFIGSALTVADTLNQLGIEVGTESGFVGTKDEIWNQYLKKSTPISDDADALELGNLTSLFGLHVYKAGGKYYYDITNGTSVRLEEFNAKMAQASPEDDKHVVRVLDNKQRTLKSQIANFEKKYGVNADLKIDGDVVTLTIPKLEIEDMKNYEKLQDYVALYKVLGY